MLRKELGWGQYLLGDAVGEDVKRQDILSHLLYCKLDPIDSVFRINWDIRCQSFNPFQRFWEATLNSYLES